MLRQEWEGALGWALEAGETGLAARLARCLYRYWAATGALAQGSAWLDAILTALPVDEAPVLIDVRVGAGVMAFNRGQFRAAARHWNAVAVAPAVAPDPLRAGHLLANRGLLAWWGSRHAGRALHRFDQAKREFSQAGTAMPLAYMHRNAAVIAAECAKFAEAEAELRASFRESALVGDASSHAMSLGDLALLSLRQGDHATAATHLRAALALNDNEAATLWLIHMLALAGEAANAGGDTWRGTLLQAAVARARRDCDLPWRSGAAAASGDLPAASYAEAWWTGSRLGLTEARALVIGG